jgi:hypothetical protein
MTLFYGAKGTSSLSDASGSFVIEHVAPGGGRVVINDGPDTCPILSRWVHVNPRQTVQVQVGGLGRPVTGRLVAPPGVEVRSWTNQVTFAQLHTQWDDYHVPKGLTGNAVERWKLEFEDTDAGRAWFRDQYSYEFKVEPDGSFTIPDVLPGKYWLFVNVGQGYLGSGSASTTSPPGAPQIAQTGMRAVVVADAPGDRGLPVDLGEVILNATH